MAMTNQGDGTGVEPGCCRNDHKMAMTNHFRSMVRAWSLGVVGATTGAMTNQFRPMVRVWSLGVVGTATR